MAKAAAGLLLELLEKNCMLSAKLGQERSAILLLVTLLNSKDEETVQLAGMALAKLSDSTENIVQMAAANWCMPLITRLCEGSRLSSPRWFTSLVILCYYLRVQTFQI